MSTKFSVSWNSYEKNVCDGFIALQHNGEFVDMTIAADGHQVKVHQMIMSLVSPYIKSLIKSAACPHPIIFLNKVSYQTLQLILEYAYSGQVLVTRDRIQEFLETCNALQIKGLENALHQTTLREEPMETPVAEPEKVCIIEDENWDSISEVEQTSNESTESHNRTESNTLSKPMKQKCVLQYSVSPRGNPQLILNRYLYYLGHVRKNNERLWRCSSYGKAPDCVADVVTRGDRVLQRRGVHTHPFHDKAILKKVQRGLVYSALRDATKITDKKKNLENNLPDPITEDDCQK